jgi:hypothetical protein
MLNALGMSHTVETTVGWRLRESCSCDCKRKVKRLNVEALRWFLAFHTFAFGIILETPPKRTTPRLRLGDAETDSGIRLDS